MESTVGDAVRDFIRENLMFDDGNADIPDDLSFLRSGLIDSTGVLELVAFLETEFGIEVADEDMLPENLDCVGSICAYVERKRSVRLAA